MHEDRRAINGPEIGNGMSLEILVSFMSCLFFKRCEILVRDWFLKVGDFLLLV